MANAKIGIETRYKINLRSLKQRKQRKDKYIVLVSKEMVLKYAKSLVPIKVVIKTSEIKTRGGSKFQETFSFILSKQTKENKATKMIKSAKIG